MFKRFCHVVLFTALASGLVSSWAPAKALDLRQTIERALNTNPSVDISRADRRAVEYQLKQSQGRLLPEVTLQGDAGYQRVGKLSNDTSEDNDKWFQRREISIAVKQVLFDGWERSYDIQRNAARLGASALRVMGQAETTGLDAVDAYIDAVRHEDLVALARANVKRHQQIFEVVNAQAEGGKTPFSDVNQIRGRVAAAEAVVAVMRQSLMNARAKFHRVVDIDANNLERVRRPTNLPRTKDAAIDRGINNNPNFHAAIAEVKAAGHAYEQSAGSMLPQVALEGSASHGFDVDGAAGRNDDVAIKLTFSWSIFDGAIKANRRRELSERLTQARSTQTLRQREVVETIERAWAALATGRERVAALNKQVSSSQQVVNAFLEEYELSKRTLLEVLDAESLLFNAKVQKISADAIRTLAGYQTLAAMGELLRSFNLEPPAEAYFDHSAQTVDWTGPFDVFVEPLR